MYILTDYSLSASSVNHADQFSYYSRVTDIFSFQKIRENKFNRAIGASSCILSTTQSRLKFCRDRFIET